MLSRHSVSRQNMYAGGFSIQVSPLPDPGGNAFLNVFRHSSGLAISTVMRQVCSMSTLVEIKEAIAHLSPQEYCELMADLQPCADDEWDLQMKADAASGKLDFVDLHIKAARQDGTLLPLEPTLDKI